MLLFLDLCSLGKIRMESQHNFKDFQDLKPSFVQSVIIQKDFWLLKKHAWYLSSSCLPGWADNLSLRSSGHIAFTLLCFCTQYQKLKILLILINAVLWFFFLCMLVMDLSNRLKTTIDSSSNLFGKCWAYHLMDTNSSEPKIGAADNLPCLPSWSCSCHVPWVPRHWVALVSSRCSTKPQMQSAKWLSRWMNQTLWVALCLIVSPTPSGLWVEPWGILKFLRLETFLFKIIQSLF